MVRLFGTAQPSTGGIADEAEAAPIIAPVTDPDTDEDELPTPDPVMCIDYCSDSHIRSDSCIQSRIPSMSGP